MLRPSLRRIDVSCFFKITVKQGGTGEPSGFFIKNLPQPILLFQFLQRYSPFFSAPALPPTTELPFTLLLQKSIHQIVLSCSASHVKTKLPTQIYPFVIINYAFFTLQKYRPQNESIRLIQLPSSIRQLKILNSQVHLLPCILLLSPNLTIIFKSENMQSHETLLSHDPSRSRGKHNKETIHTNKEVGQTQEDLLTLQELRAQNTKLKKLLREAQAKRTHITKECSQLARNVQQLESENSQLQSRLREEEDKCGGEKHRWEQLRFLNKQLSSQLEALRTENEALVQKLRYTSQVLERKYEDLEEKSQKRTEQCVKRLKKTVHYLETLSAREIDRTRDMLAENLRKAIELLRGKTYEELPCEGEIEELMNPLRTMQEEVSQKTREAGALRQENMRLNEELAKFREMEKEQIPMFKEAIEKLKKNLVQVRGQLSENQYEKLQLKKRYEQRIKQAEHKYNELFKENRKIKLENKIYENKLADMQADVEEEKERLIGENQMLKKLYRPSDSHLAPLTTHPLADSRTEEKRGMRKQHSTNELRTSNGNIHSASQYQLDQSEYNEEGSGFSQEDLKQEIFRIDEEIMEIQKNLTKELEAYR